MKDITKVWKSLASTKQVTKELTFQYCLLRAIRAKSEEKEKIALYFLRRAFIPITNPNKLGNGMQAYGAMYRASFAQTSSLLECIETEEEQALYQNFKNNLPQIVSEGAQEVTARLEAKRHEVYCYIFVRQDLSIAQQLVQVAHVSAKMGKLAEQNELLNRLNLVVCGAKDLGRLQDICSSIESYPFHETKVIQFTEPDLNSELTAIATPPVTYKDRRRFRQYRLWIPTQVVK